MCRPCTSRPCLVAWAPARLVGSTWRTRMYASWPVSMVQYLRTSRSHTMPSLLCLVVHPDDETIMCGGTLALLSARGVGVHVGALTRGEGGEMGEPPLTDRGSLGQLRESEMGCAVGKLGG